MNRKNSSFFLPVSNTACYIKAILILFFFYSTRLQAQNKKIDSLNQLISVEKNDSSRIKLNITKIDVLANSDLNNAIILGKEQLKEAEKIKFYNGVVELRSQLANNYIFTGDYSTALDNIHFLEKYIKPKDSINYASIASLYGMMYGVKGEYDSSILFYSKSIEINERIHNEMQLPGNYANIAIGYQQLANYPMALKYQQKGLLLAQKNKNKSVEARTMMNMAITYQNIGDTAKAIQEYQSSIDLAKKINSKIVELYAYSNLSTLYIGKQQWTEAYDLAIKSAELAAASGDKGIGAANLSKAAISLAHQNKFAEAAEISKKSILLADSSAQPLNISQAYNSMAITLFLQKKYREAIPYFEKNLAIVKKNLVYDLTYGDAYKQLSECYAETGNYKKALECYQLGADLTDSMRRKENIRKATELSMNFDFQKKQELQEAEQKLKDRTAHSRLIAVLIGLGIFLLLSVFAFIGYKNKQRANALLKKQKKQIELTLHQLKSTQAQLIQSEKMASLGELTAGIAHEIQNPLNFVNNFSEVNKEMLEELNAEMQKPINERDDNLQNDLIKDVLENSVKINQHGKRADAIVKGMLQHSRTSSGQKEMTNINAICNEYLKLSYHGMRAKDKSFNAEMKTDFDTSFPKINVIPQDIGRVILNLINNAFYAVNERKKLNESGYEPIIWVSTKRVNDKIEISVKDNGNGIP
ncbi:MAG: tetratricopeptide repeat protein, partial [Bacteroidetes bacterium]|nr:tetratricopeptide repeat protein [Bacteroidota bacterium]